MRPLSFVQRCLLALLATALTAWISAWLLTGTLIGTAAGLLLTLGVGLALGRWLRSFITTQHEHFQVVMRDLRESLPSGRPALQLKSERPADSFGSLAASLNTLVQETSRQLAQHRDRNQDLEHTKTLFQSILGTMIEGVLVLDAQSRVLYFNAAARRVLDSSSRLVEGRPLWEVARDADLQDVIDHVLVTGQDCRREVEFKRSRSLVEITAAQMPLTPRPGVVVVLHEVTELRRLERMRREFVSNVSHELKTPLTSIQAYADTLLEGGLEDADHRRSFVSRIIEQSNRLQVLIQDMLRLARIESQSEAFQLGPVDLKEVLRQSVEARQAVARARQIELRLREDSTSPRVLADPEGLRTIIDNLVNNALNYTREGGQVEVRWSRDESQVTIEVQDNGIGIAAEHRERIFERFYRVDKARSRGLGGTGLGLAIVKHLTVVFGGDVQVLSVVGQGSTFRVRLPVATEAAESLSADELLPSTSRSGHEAF